MVGIASRLGYIAAIVIAGATVAVSFGSYATSLFVGSDAGPARDNVFTSAVVLGTLDINIVGSRIVDRAQSAIAEAARPALGDASFGMTALAAILATTSSVNA